MLLVENIRVRCRSCECPFFGKCDWIPTEIHYHTDKSQGITFFFVGQGGGEKESEARRPFIGPSGQRLKGILNDLVKEYGPFNYALSNNIRTRPPENRKPNHYEIKACRTLLRKDVKKLNPKIVVALGLSARNSLVLEKTHPSLKTLRKRGIEPCRFKDLNKNRFSLITTFHPSPINSGKDVEQCIKEDLIPFIIGE